MIESSPNPPLLDKYTQLLCHSGENLRGFGHKNEVVMEECELPLIDLGGLRSGNEEERLACAAAISKASSEWGFFQLVNHGISLELLRKMRREQIKLFEAPFERKTTCGLFNNSYRWGNHTATTPNQLSWSEAFHVPLTKISEEACYQEFSSLRYYHYYYSLFSSLSTPHLASIYLYILTCFLLYMFILIFRLTNEK